MRVTLLFSVALFATPLASAQNLREVQNLSYGIGGQAQECALAISDSQNRALVAFITLTVSGFEVWAINGELRDGGKTWQPTSGAWRLDSDSTGALKSDLMIEAESGFFYVGWLDDRDGVTKTKLRLSRTIDSFNPGFGPDVVIPTNDLGIDKDVKAWDISAISNYVHIASRSVWTASRDAVFQSHSGDSGATWFSPLLVTTPAAGVDDVDDIAIYAVIPSNVCVAWMDNRSGLNQVWVRQGDGLGWSGMEVRLDNPSQGKSVDGLCIDGSSIGGISGIDSYQVAWCQEGAATTSESLWIASSTAAGFNWSSAQMIGTYAAGTDDVDNPSILSAASQVVIAWEDNRNGNDQVYTVFSNDHGASFSGDLNHAGTTGAEPKLSGDDQVVALVWREVSGIDHLIIDTSVNGGQTWNGSQELSGGLLSGDADGFSVATDSSWHNILVAGLVDQGVGNEIWLGGTRLGQIRAIGDLTAGSTLFFKVDYVPAQEEGWWFEVVCSENYGEWAPQAMFPRWAEIDATDGWFNRFRRLIIRGQIVGGSGQSVALNVPQLPAGLGLRLVAILRRELPHPGGTYGTITDPIFLTVP